MKFRIVLSSCRKVQVSNTKNNQFYVIGSNGVSVSGPFDSNDKRFSDES